MQDVALQRVMRLFELAKKEFETNPERSRRYVVLARQIGMKYNVRFPKELKVQFCKACGAFWVAGKNVKVRTNPKTKATEFVCLECSKVKRFGYSAEKK